MIVVVSGLPRSGTSLVMQMLAAGGMPVLSDEHRAADEHNPRGYLEDRRVKTLERDNGWLGEAEGKALKVVSPLLRRLPLVFDYRVIFLRRDLDEVLRSQERMLAGLGQPGGPPADAMRRHFERHLSDVRGWLAQQPRVRTLEIDFRAAVEEPRPTVERLVEFLETPLDVAAMARCVDRDLYRQRAPDDARR